MTPSSLAAWSLSPIAPSSIHLEVDSAPSRLERDWLAALSAAGSNVSWSGNLPAVMVDAQPVASPDGGIRTRIAAPANSNVEIADEAGVIDSIQSSEAGVSLTVGSAVGSIAARVANSTATNDSKGLSRSEKSACYRQRRMGIQIRCCSARGKWMEG
jgi:hypothetical protein